MNNNKTKKAKHSMENIRKASIEEFSKYGYDRTRISDIVSKAGLSQRSFYIYFESKEALYKELVRDWISKLTPLFEVDKYSSEYEKVIKKRWHAIFNYMLENPRLTRTIFLMNPFFEEEVRKPLHEKLVSVMSWDKKMGLMREDVIVEYMAEATLASIQVLALRYVLSDEVDPEVIAKQFSEIHYKGVGKNKIRE